MVDPSSRLHQQVNTELYEHIFAKKQRLEKAVAELSSGPKELSSNQSTDFSTESDLNNLNSRDVRIKHVGTSDETVKIPETEVYSTGQTSSPQECSTGQLMKNSEIPVIIVCGDPQKVNLTTNEVDSI